MESTAAIQDSHQTHAQPSRANDGATSETVKSENVQTRYGCLGWRPACLQFLTHTRWFLLFCCLAAFYEALVVNGFLGVTISTIERRFAFSSSQTSWIAATYEVAGAPALLVIGYLGSTLRRPVWIAGGLIILGIGLGVYSIPHFVAPPYRYSDSSDFSNLCVQPISNSSTNASSAENDRSVMYNVEMYRYTKFNNNYWTSTGNTIAILWIRARLYSLSSSSSSFIDTP